MTILRLLKKQYEDIEGSLYCFKNLDIDLILKEWVRKDAIYANKIVIGLKETYLVYAINSNRMKEILMEMDPYKPISMLKLNEINKKEKGKFTSLEDTDFTLAKNLFTSFFKGEQSSSIPIPADATLAQQLKKTYHTENEIDHLLKKPTAKQANMMQSTNEITTLLQAPTAKEKIINEQFKTKGGIDAKKICPYATKTLCREMNYAGKECELIHFRKFIQPHTDESMGDCELLNTCPNMESCNKIHYIPDDGLTGMVFFKSIDENIREMTHF